MDLRFNLEFFSLYYKPFPVIYFRQYLTKQNDVTISDRRDTRSTGLNGFDESGIYRKFVKGLVLKRYC